MRSNIYTTASLFIIFHCNINLLTQEERHFPQATLRRGGSFNPELGRKDSPGHAKNPGPVFSPMRGVSVR